jgi:hypothetical protein
MSDLTGEVPGAIAAERSRVASEGWGARLLALQGLDGNWGDGASKPKTQDTHLRRVETVLSQDDLARRNAASEIRRNPLDIPLNTWMDGGGGPPTFRHRKGVRSLWRRIIRTASP